MASGRMSAASLVPGRAADACHGSHPSHLHHQQPAGLDPGGAAAAVRFLDLAWWLAAGLVATWIVKDLLLYPRMRWYYEPEPAEWRLVGERGIALTGIDPQGFVRVRGEIWQADAPPNHHGIAEGAAIRVRDVRGLRLTVEPREETA